MQELFGVLISLLGAGTFASLVLRIVDRIEGAGE